jgi:hypothetical protein
MDIYVGTVWYHQSVPSSANTDRDTYTRRIYKLSAASVDDFKQQVRQGEDRGGEAIEFGPIGPSWRRR